MKNWLTTTEALKYCKSRDRSLTKTGLKYLGLLHRFVRKKENGHHLEYNISGLDRITRLSEPPEGYISAKHISNKLDIKLENIYRILKKYKIKTYKYGFRNIYYFLEEEFVDAYNENEEQRDKECNNEKESKIRKD